ncbi:E3 ubiquitin-protein ligase TRIM39-like [Rhinatrema bivittatum]|uniref:E3 ubiquitin-protein ligase TRIM39-like n=1 Tax=Rhinatrema bivittatum TaxID=194408 RepID=UPI00112A557C|nr:E3 ubiquitin-protein ligase TRIM39-like [Rhinatrema bivittatum]
MAAANPAESLQDEASCSICLDYFTDPVITDCGHNYCRVCILQIWEGKDSNFPCPQCRKLIQQRSLRPNRQLANMTEIAKQLSQCSVREKGENLCPEHEERLKLFCQEEQAPICLVCRESREHRSHTVTPIEEAVQEYKKKIQLQLEPLRKELEGLQQLRSGEEKKAEELRSETEVTRQKIESRFEDVQQLLNEEKRILLSRLEEEEEKILLTILENVTRLEEQSSSIKLLISEMEEKSQQPAAELLKDVKDTLSRCQKLKFPEPKVVSAEMKMNFQLTYSQQLMELITDFGEWSMEHGRYADVAEPEYPGASQQEAWKERTHAWSMEGGRQQGLSAGGRALEADGVYFAGAKAELMGVFRIQGCAWIIGHSFIYWAQRKAMLRPNGEHLYLERWNWRIAWFGKQGMGWDELLPFLQEQVDMWGVPRIIVIHLGGNDVGRKSCRELLACIRKDLAQIMIRWPSVKVGWSDIIVRVKCKEEVLWKKGVKKMNQQIGKWLMSQGGFWVRHKWAWDVDDGLFCGDGVLLSEVGLDLFNKAVQEGIEKVIVRS